MQLSLQNEVAVGTEKEEFRGSTGSEDEPGTLGRNESDQSLRQELFKVSSQHLRQTFMPRAVEC